MLNEIRVPQASIRSIGSSAEAMASSQPSSQFCLPSNSSLPSCIYAHEIVSLILAAAVLIRAVRGSSSR
ncbi:MAG: hypothetical protein KME15_18345 [Drouetiella hepatica Uher 2000/2452]|jgi:hypothetical protein|uniref:Uncharacterized protein n=1 Tax=Drouetiella hepatica Uher 2000/2452 TaxID=904376 RepID=A0A951UNN3_9CYAN|nr:hypothetical protein [Drouetiella hepatica Uher 2000/2452]